MNHVRTFKNVIIAVAFNGFRSFVRVPLDMELLLYGVAIEDSAQAVDMYPDRAGVYVCDIEYWFSQGYHEGMPSDGESEWDFIPRNIKEIDLTKWSSMKIPRFLHMLYARAHAYFWLPCPICNKKFGGHENKNGTGLMRTMSSGSMVCPNCNKRAQSRNQEMLGATKEETYD